MAQPVGISEAAGYCTACGSAYSSGQAYCGRCGQRLAAGHDPLGDQVGVPAGTLADQSQSAQQQVPAAPDDDAPYGAGATLGAVLVTVFMPVIGLIAAVVLRSQERRPRRRQFLKNWAIGSAVWLCTGWLIGIIAFSAVGSGSAGCQGGIDQLVPPSYQSSDGVHWQATYMCMNGGSETKSVPRNQVPGGGG